MIVRNHPVTKYRTEDNPTDPVAIYTSPDIAPPTPVAPSAPAEHEGCVIFVHALNR